MPTIPLELTTSLAMATALLWLETGCVPEEKAVFLRRTEKLASIGFLASVTFVALSAGFSAKVWAQEELSRKTKTRIAPAYPELARRMNITGTVKVLVVVAPNGNLKDTKVMGGNPLLVNAAMNALKKWKFEPADSESSGTVEFKFQSQN